MTAFPPHDRSDEHDLASFGYKQDLARTLGAFSSFATGFAFISILTGAFQLFFFAYRSAGPAFWWTWLVAVAGQLLFALCFAELATRYPLAGSVYNWAKHLSGPGMAWLAGICLTLALVVSTASVALAMQFVLPEIWSGFQVVGDGTGRHDYAFNGVLLGAAVILASTLLNILGVRAIAVINNIGVCVEFLATLLLIVLFVSHVQRGPEVVLQTGGTGADHTLGVTGALLTAGLLGIYVLWGFDTAGSVGEETVAPRRTNPRAIIRAVAAAGALGGALLLTALMAVDDLQARELSLSGLPYIVEDALGEALGKTILSCVAVAVFICALANQTGAIRMIFAMSRDNALPGSTRLARISRRSRTPALPAALTGAVSMVILGANAGQPQAFLAVASTAVVLALLAYVMVVGPLSLRWLRHQFEPTREGYFSLGRWGPSVSLAAFVWGCAVIINTAWPRKAVYNPDAPFHWYLQWGAVLFVVIALGLSFAFYWSIQRHKLGKLTDHTATPLEGE
ncbi:APC family permease [Streptomyces longwoodensis]|uniref:APC family permease n=1 Tax=Streptomyces longwoodensis TaxID=68231 RepID=UPI0036FD2A8D